MKKLMYAVLLSAGCAGFLVGYHDVSKNHPMKPAKKMAPEKMTTRSKHAIENDIKTTEKKMNDLDKRMASERNTMRKQDMQKHRSHETKRLQHLEEELKRAK